MIDIQIMQMMIDTYSGGQSWLYQLDSTGGLWRDVQSLLFTSVLSSFLTQDTERLLIPAK